MNKQGFTLIEMLVVVLIIGILSAVALPQYQKSVDRARTTEAMMATKTILDAAAIYAASMRACPTSFSDLTIKIKETGKDWSYELGNVGARNCAVIVKSTKDNKIKGRHVYVKNPSYEGVPSGVGSGDMYWDCPSGEDCTEFFFDLGVKKSSAGEFYQ